jgi:hypothetical protein
VSNGAKGPRYRQKRPRYRQKRPTLQAKETCGHGGEFCRLRKMATASRSSVSTSVMLPPPWLHLALRLTAALRSLRLGGASASASSVESRQRGRLETRCARCCGAFLGLSIFSVLSGFSRTMTSLATRTRSEATAAPSPATSHHTSLTGATGCKRCGINS